MTSPIGSPLPSTSQSNQSSPSAQNNRPTEEDGHLTVPNIVLGEEERRPVFVQRFLSAIGFLKPKVRQVPPSRDIPDAETQEVILSFLTKSEFIYFFLNRSWDYNKSKTEKAANYILRDLADYIMGYLSFFNREGDVLEPSRDMVRIERATRCICYIYKEKGDDPRAKVVKSYLIDHIQNLPNKEDLIVKLFTVGPTKTIFFFIEDFLPEDQRKVFKECVSQPKFLSAQALYRANSRGFSFERHKQYDFYPHYLKNMTAAFPETSDFILAVSCLNHLYSFDPKEGLKSLLSEGFKIIRRPYKMREWMIALRGPEDLSPWYIFQDGWEKKLFNIHKFFAPLFELKTGDVAQAILVYGAEKINCERLFPLLLETPLQEFFRPTSNNSPALTSQRYEKLEEILLALTESVGLEALFVNFFNLNDHIVILDTTNNQELNSRTFSMFRRFLDKVINQEMGEEFHNEIKKLHQKYEEIDDVFLNKKWERWKSDYEIEYINIINSLDSKELRKWAVCYCFLYYASNITFSNNVGSYEDIDPHYKFMKLYNDSHWESLVTYTPEFARMVLDIMRRSCGDKQKREDGNAVIGIPQALLDLEKS